MTTAARTQIAAHGEHWLIAFDKPANNFLSALSAYASWGYFDPGDAAGGSSTFGDYRDGYQNIPVNWGINTDRKRSYFDLLAQVTGAKG